MYGRNEHYAKRADRDAAAKEYRKRGKRIRLSTSTNIILSPDYVIGYDMANASPNGFGGSSPTFMAKVYNIDQTDY